jgi:hypothetical protein
MTVAIPLALVVGLAVGFLAGWLTHRGGLGSTELVIQEGKLSHGNREVVAVYYARPFVERPTLEINYPPGALTILEERNDGFTIQGNPDSYSRNIQWRARGKVAK